MDRMLFARAVSPESIVLGWPRVDRARHDRSDLNDQYLLPSAFTTSARIAAFCQRVDPGCPGGIGGCIIYKKDRHSPRQPARGPGFQLAVEGSRVATRRGDFKE